LLSPGAYAQKAQADKHIANTGIEHIRKSSIEAQLAFLSSDALEGREAGKQGGKVAAEYIKSVLQDVGVKPYFDSYFQPFESYSPARERHVEFQVHPDSIAKYKQGSAYRRLQLQNVAGYIEGKKKDEYIVLGAHYDHVGIDELLVGDQVYNGADDNGASVAAVLQVAKAFAASGIQPEKSIIFAFWDGEEVNYLGSEYFVLNFPQLSRIGAYINLDMVGRRDGYAPVFYPVFDASAPTAENTASGKQFHLLYTQELTGASRQLAKDMESQKLNVEAKQSVIHPAARGSDQLSFSLRGVPVQWFFTGLHPDYHTPQDQIDRIDLDKLTGLTKAVYLSVEQLANSRE
jgi:hypothetical protein